MQDFLYFHNSTSKDTEITCVCCLG